MQPGEARQDLLHFLGGDVLSFPAEGVADAVHEVVEPVRIFFHEVAGLEEQVPLLEDVAE